MCTLARSLQLDSWSSLVRLPRGSGWYERPRIWRYCKCPVRVANGRMLAVYDNGSISCILHARHRDCLQTVELRRCHRLASIPTKLVQRWLCWVGHAAWRPEDELIRNLLLPLPPRSWRKRAWGQLKTWATTIKEDREPLSGPQSSAAHDLAKISNELAQDIPAWGVSIRDVANSIGDAGSPNPRTRKIYWSRAIYGYQLKTLGIEVLHGYIFSDVTHSCATMPLWFLGNRFFFWIKINTSSKSKNASLNSHIQGVSRLWHKNVSGNSTEKRKVGHSKEWRGHITDKLTFNLT